MTVFWLHLTTVLSGPLILGICFLLGVLLRNSAVSGQIIAGGIVATVLMETGFASNARGLLGSGLSIPGLSGGFLAGAIFTVLVSTGSRFLLKARTAEAED